MRSLLLLALLGALPACDASGPIARTPSARLADEIEAKLSKIACIGRMSRWERRYRYSSRPSTIAKALTLGRSDRWFKYTSVDIDYRQAGFDEFRTRRIFYRGAPPFEIDDRHYDLVFGHYDVPTHTGYIWACGRSFADPQHPSVTVR